MIGASGLFHFFSGQVKSEKGTKVIPLSESLGIIGGGVIVSFLFFKRSLNRRRKRKKKPKLKTRAQIGLGLGTIVAAALVGLAIFVNTLSFNF